MLTVLRIATRTGQIEQFLDPITIGAMDDMAFDQQIIEHKFSRIFLVSLDAA